MVIPVVEHDRSDNRNPRHRQDLFATAVEAPRRPHPGVVESAAVGVPDDSLGQRVAVALVVNARATSEIAEQVRHHCREQLPSYMVPAEIHVRASLPRNVNGKCDRSLLSVQLAAVATPELRA